MQSHSGQHLQIVVSRTGAVICGRALVARSFWRRTRGLIGRRDWQDGWDGLYFPHCSSVHSFFMQMDYDLLFVDADGVVVGRHVRIPPWRLGPFSSRGKGPIATLELPSGHLDTVDLQVGDRLEILPIAS